MPFELLNILQPNFIWCYIIINQGSLWKVWIVLFMVKVNVRVWILEIVREAHFIPKFVICVWPVVRVYRFWIQQTSLLLNTFLLLLVLTNSLLVLLSFDSVNVHLFLYSFHAMCECKRVIRVGRETCEAGTSSYVGSVLTVPHTVLRCCVASDIGTCTDHPGPQAMYMSQVLVLDRVWCGGLGFSLWKF